MSKKIFILRHAHTESFSESGKDFGRNLTEGGYAEAQRMAQRLAAESFQIDHVICSTANRTQQTLEMIWSGFGAKAPQVTHSDSVYLADLEELMTQIHLLPDEQDSVMLVGHNPGLHQLVQSLSGSPLAKFSPCTLAILQSAETQWKNIAANSMKLADLITV